MRIDSGGDVGIGNGMQAAEFPIFTDDRSLILGAGSGSVGLNYILQRLVIMVFTLEMQILVVTDIKDILSINIMTTQTLDLPLTDKSGFVNPNNGF